MIHDTVNGKINGSIVQRDECEFTFRYNVIRAFVSVFMFDVMPNIKVDTCR